MTLISVVIPTVAGREEHLERCLDAYRANTDADVELLVYHDLNGCGIGWQHGAEDATGDYLHFSADDLEPHPGWDVAAIKAVDSGVAPCCRIYQPDGAVWFNGGRPYDPDLRDGDAVPASVVPFMRIDWWRHVTPMIPCHYFTDNYVSWRLGRAGIPTVLTGGYDFTHHWAQHKRGAGLPEPERMAVDQAFFLTTVQMLTIGETQ